jgi:DNA-binding NarL/FixJ family response regulator
MPELGGAETTRLLRKKMPDLHIVALTMHEEPGYVRELLEAGASGYVLKWAAPEELLPALRAVSAGGTYVDPRVMTKLVATLAPERHAQGRRPGRTRGGGTAAGGVWIYQSRDRRIAARQYQIHRNASQPGHEKIGPAAGWRWSATPPSGAGWLRPEPQLSGRNP